MITDNQDLNEIVRDGGEFWMIEVLESGTWRPWIGSADRDEARDAYTFEKKNRPAFNWRVKKITVTATVLDWDGLDFG